MKRYVAILILLGIVVSGFSAEETKQHIGAMKLKRIIPKLAPLHAPISKPGPNDWLMFHEEPGQTFEEYLRSQPVQPDKIRNVIYVQPIGEFTPTQEKILRLTREYMELYFGLPVRALPAIPLSEIPAKARRTHPTWGDKQILAPYVLSKVLLPERPTDAVAMITFTSSDLWPGEDWNFVFGAASLRHRVGVWSIYRYGDPDKDKSSYRKFLKRTIKVAIHETGHMFSILHCTAYECIMCGSNHLKETDKRPMYLCPEDLAKICWTTQQNPLTRYIKLEQFCKRNNLKEERAFFLKSITQLEKLPEKKSQEKPSPTPP